MKKKPDKASALYPRVYQFLKSIWRKISPSARSRNGFGLRPIRGRLSTNIRKLFLGEAVDFPQLRVQEKEEQWSGYCRQLRIRSDGLKRLFEWLHPALTQPELLPEPGSPDHERAIRGWMEYFASPDSSAIAPPSPLFSGRPIKPIANPEPFITFAEPNRLWIVFRGLGRTHQEFSDGKVPLHPIAETARDRIMKEGWAWLNAPMALGKTTLACQVGLRPELGFAGGCWYYDLMYLGDSDKDEAALFRALEGMSGQPRDEVRLVILDNTHVQPGLAMALHERCSELGLPHLWLGRKVSRDESDRPSLSLQQPEGIEPLDFGTSAELIRQIASFEFGQWGLSPVPTPPEGWISRATELYGGDLFAFRIALKARKEEIQRAVAPDHWRIEPGDAIDYVDNSILGAEGVTDGMRRGLIRLALLQRLDLWGAANLFEKQSLRKFLYHTRGERHDAPSFAGLVLREEYGGGLNKRSAAEHRRALRMRSWYRLAHASHGRMIVEAARRRASWDEARELASLATSAENGLLGVAILNRLTMGDSTDAELAASFMRRWVEEAGLCGLLASSPLDYLPQFLRFLRERLALPMADIVICLTRQLEREDSANSFICDRGVEGGLNGFVYFLEFVRDRKNGMEGVWELLRTRVSVWLQDGDNQDRIINRGMVDGLNWFVHFLKYVRDDMNGLEGAWEPLRTRVSVWLQDGGHQDRIINRGVEGRPNFLVRFLEFVRDPRSGLEGAWKPLTTKLSEWMLKRDFQGRLYNANRLVDRGVEGGLGHFTHFLEFVRELGDGLEGPYRSLESAIIRRLAEPTDTQPSCGNPLAPIPCRPTRSLVNVVRNHLEGPLDGLSTFLEFWFQGTLLEPRERDSEGETPADQILDLLNQALLDVIQRHAGAETLIGTGLRRGFESTFPLVRHVQSQLPEEAQRLLASSLEDRAQEISTHLRDCSLGSVQAFARLFPDVASRKLGDWDEATCRAWAASKSNWSGCGAALSALFNCGAERHARALSFELLHRMGATSGWQRQGIDLPSFSRALSMVGQELGETEIAALFRKGLDGPEFFLPRQFKNRSSGLGPIIGALYIFGRLAPPNLYAELQRIGWFWRLDAEIRGCWGSPAPAAAHPPGAPAEPPDPGLTIRFLGVAALIDFVLPKRLLTLIPSGSALSKLYSAHYDGLQEKENEPAPETDRQRFGWMQIQFWLGLRAITSATPNVLTGLNRPRADDDLRRWKTIAEEQKGRPVDDRFNAWMIEWMERCRDSDWILQNR